MSTFHSPKTIGLSTAAGRIEAADRILITTHTRADGDAVGCVTALIRLLEGRGKNVRAILHETVPARYAFLPDVGALQIWDVDRAAEALSAADLLILVDTCASAQLGDVAESIRSARLPRLAIDHHVTRDDVADEILLDETAGACARIITRLADHAGWSIDADSATLLFVGLMTDTGWLRFSNTHAAELATAARLVEAGARPDELYERLYLQDAEPRVRLIGEVLTSLELLAAGRLAVLRITEDMLSRCGAARDMTEEIINEPQRMGSVVVCVLFVEPEGDGPVRVSFRSKRDVDVAAIARRFGGGGHPRASGAKITGTLEAVHQQVVPVVVRALDGKEPSSE
ncbi:MAG: bifunctional oligoribonuclease/PAP phosphatase NrnA [Phycisphaerae bacterium]